MKKILTILMATGLIFIFGCEEKVPALTAFTACLKEKEVTMYGSYTCPHCLNQKEFFGANFEEVNYVECNPNGPSAQVALCNEKGISSVPAWEMPDGSFLLGEQSLEELSEKTGCELNINK